MSMRMDIGIDLGSTYSTFATHDEQANFPRALTVVQGEPASIPSVVSINRWGQFTCGKAAKGQIGKRNVHVYEAFKMLLVEQNAALLRSRGYDEFNSPRRITGLFLQSQLEGVLSREAGRGNYYDGFDHVYICMPETWANGVKSTDGRHILREILMNEVDIPINHVHVVTEPEAASAFIAFNYNAKEHRPFNGYLLLIDYGGGTLDLALTEVTSDSDGIMEIFYRESDGIGENHPEKDGIGRIGSAGIAFMQNLLLRALQAQNLLEDGQNPDYTDPSFCGAMQDLESLLKAPERIKQIKAIFSEFGSYRNVHKILSQDPIYFTTVEYGGSDVEITFQQMFMSYQEVVETVLREEVTKFNVKVAKAIGSDPCDPAAGNRDNFKIALVGGFGSFFLVKMQLSEIYNLDANPAADRRIKNIAADKREQAISLGAALLAAGKMILHKTARNSIGIYSFSINDDSPKGHLCYGIKYHQLIEPNTPYFLLCDENLPDVPENRVVYGGLQDNITTFSIEYSDRRNHGGLMKLKQKLIERMQALPEDGYWNLGFSMDEDDVVTFHVVPCQTFGSTNQAPITITLESFNKMFDLTAVKEVTV